MEFQTQEIANTIIDYVQSCKYVDEVDVEQIAFLIDQANDYFDMGE